MALRYLCDQCGEIRLPEEMHGGGVFTEEGKGRPMHWETPGDDYGLVIEPYKRSTDQQICKGCVLGMLREMVDELSSEVDEADESFLEPADEVTMESGLFMGAISLPGGGETEEWLGTENKLARQWHQRRDEEMDEIQDRYRRALHMRSDGGERSNGDEDQGGSDRASGPVPELRPTQAVPVTSSDDPPRRLEDPLHFDDDCICLTLRGEGGPAPGRHCPARVHRPR